jgi:hypothetical protein
MSATSDLLWTIGTVVFPPLGVVGGLLGVVALLQRKQRLDNFPKGTKQVLTLKREPPHGPSADVRRDKARLP